MNLRKLKLEYLTGVAGVDERRRRRVRAVPPRARRPVMKASVLITCYRRRRFLQLSLASALADRADEVVVVKDWADTAVDRELASAGVTVVTEDIPIIGEALARGLDKCTGDTVSFLDDDDLILPGRLDAVRRAFGSSESLVLLKNGYTEVDVEGNAFVPPGGPVAQPRAPREFSCDRVDDSTLRWIVAHHAYGILSTITVRCAPLQALSRDLARVECGIDVAVPTLLMRGRLRHSFVPDPLTVHRIGSSLRAGTPSGTPAAYARTFRRLARSAGSDAARRYALMNVRWAELEMLLGRPRLDAIERLRSGASSPSLRELARVLLPSAVEDRSG
jgi:glycosyl transferase family 2